ncbi:glycoside hydrolase family 32 protein [Convivina intestini]|uniref:Sucrose-6-phosphate hydrolase n=1 Tax=Convivina intestini TaxID=1505726 RepID=A0A2U1DF66_9LACO|nr:glycoside hydrolase family 32 protein [Convivina intestini]PVY86321.1 beta-fructofuranosidase [Convivina intestini]CAH1850862.1 Sucrose-6-phosphate hydrolase [Convivina intestini]SDB82479.1 beta-fructofuranosidase [Leuconostocaceae bacterium R-53105]
MLVKNDPTAYEANHLYPEFGLLNDPNGLVYFKGKYHVFYQWNPKGCNHKYKEWGHFISDDLQTWQRVEPALKPSMPDLDSAGIYSGTALVKDDRLYLFYTGNVRNGQGQSVKSTQMWAVSDDGIHFEKLGQLFPHPEGFTKDVRDPMVWQGKNGHYFLILGAQHDNQIGDIIIYESADLTEWTFKGSLLGEQLSDIRGYMLECPDLIEFDGKQVLMFSPQGLPADLMQHRFQNIHNTGYVVGHFDEEKARFEVQGDFNEVDEGFEFYAPQTMLAPNHRKIMWGWVGMMPPKREAEVPTIAKQNWVHTLSLPRELHLNAEQKLVQQPIVEILDPKPLTNFEDSLKPGQYTIDTAADWTLKLGHNAELKKRGAILHFERRQWESGEIGHRQMQGKVDQLLLMVDHDVIEIYTQDGLNVMTGRWFG